MSKTKKRNIKKRNTKRKKYNKGGGITEKESTRFEYLLYPSYSKEPGKPRKIRLITKLHKNYPRPYFLNMVKSNAADVDEFLHSVVSNKNPPIIYRSVQDIEPIISSDEIETNPVEEEKQDDKTKFEKMQQEFDKLKEEFDKLKEENEKLKENS